MSKEKPVKLYLPKANKTISITSLDIDKDDDRVLNIEYDIIAEEGETLDDVNTPELQEEVGVLVEKLLIKHVEKLEKE